MTIAEKSKPETDFGTFNKAIDNARILPGFRTIPGIQVNLIQVEGRHDNNNDEHNNDHSEISIVARLIDWLFSEHAILVPLSKLHL